MLIRISLRLQNKLFSPCFPPALLCFALHLKQSAIEQLGLESRKVSELLIVTGSSPFTLLNHLIDRATNLGTSGNNVVDSKLVEGASILDVLKGGFEVFEFGFNLGR